MPLVCLGLSHRTAPAEVRERHAFPPERMSEALVALRDYEAISEAAMLSTCGRMEIYAEIDDPERGIAQLKRFLVSFRHSDIAYDIEPYLYVLNDGAAVDQLLHVATGLDSMLVGEAEILGQVKQAYHQAQHARSLGTVLHRLFADALNAGKAARSQTAIGGASVSLATAAVTAAKLHARGLAGRSVTLVGAGKMALTAGRRLKFEGLAEFTVVNRTFDRARALVTRLDYGEAVEAARLVEAVRAADVVITSTGAPEFILTPEDVGEAMRTRPARPLCIIDVALPRDVHPSVAELPGVHVIDVDQLGATVDLKLETRRRAIPLVETIISDHVVRFMTWYRARTALPVIASLAQKAETLRAAEVARLFARCPHLDERERTLITGMSLTLLSKLLHPAYAKIRETAGEDQAAAFVQACIVDALFALHLAERVPPAAADELAPAAPAMLLAPVT